MSQTDIKGLLAILDESPVGISISRRRDGVVVYANRRFLELVGSTSEHFVGSVARTYFVDDEQRRSVIDQLKAKGHVNDIDAVFRRADGTQFWTLLTIGPAVLDGEDVNLAWVYDIHERKMAERALAESQSLMRGLIDVAADGIALLAPDGTLLTVNSVAAAALGGTPDQLVGANLWTLEPAAIIAQAKDAVEQVYANGRPGRHCHHHRGRFFENHIYPIANAAGQIDKLAVFLRDITGRKRAEEQLRIAATAFESQEGIVIADADGVILRVNRAFTEITGYTAEEAVGRKTNLLSSGRHDAAFYADMWGNLHNEGVWQGEIWNRRKNGETYPEWLTITAVKGDAKEVTHYVATMTDITSRKAAEDEIKHLAFYDPLTRLPNRRLLLDRLQQALVSSTRSGREGALLFIDLDNFKTLNDTRGHEIGDLLLQQVAHRVAHCVREGDTVARLGGDEFVVMLEDLSENPEVAAAQVRMVCEKILAAIKQPYSLFSQEYHCTASIGATLFGAHRESVDELLKQADIAMYQAKAEGRNALRFFDPALHAVVKARATLEADLRQAIADHQFLLYYQPQVDGEHGLTGAEALVRWRHPVRGLVPPSEFIPLAEETGLILPLGRWVMETACAQLVAWARRPEAAHLTLAVNVSARQFRQPDFAEQVLSVLDRTGADPRKLKLELTESMLLDDVEDAIAKMTVLRGAGIGFSLDDFGTGYSSLSYVKRLPLSQLKIDQSFISDLNTNPHDAAIARTIVTLAQSLGLTVIAEGVETEEQRQFLLGQGCDAYQGYLFSRPLPAEEFDRFLDREKCGLGFGECETSMADG